MILTKKELADKLKISTRTVERMMTRGMPHMKNERIVRFNYDKVIEWMEEPSCTYKAQ